MKKRKIRKRIIAFIGVIAVAVTSFSTIPTFAEEEKEKVQTADEIIDGKLKEFEKKEYSMAELEELKHHFIYDSAEYLEQVPKENEIVNTKKVRLATADVVDHVVGAEFTYGSWFTNFFTANGNTAYCVQPMIVTPTTGKYSISRYVSNNNRFAKGLYYWYGGLGYETWRSNFGNLGSVSQVIPESEAGMTHALLSYLYDPNGDPFKGMPQEWVDALLAQIPNLDSLPATPQGFEAYVYNEGTPTQTMGGWVYNPYGTLRIKKISGDTGMTDGNNCYSLKDATYEVYTPNTTNRVGTLVTDVNGLSNTITLEAGEYDILETKAPKGFALDTTRKRVTIKPRELNNQFVTKPFVDYPQSDPVGMWVGKIDLDTTLEMPQGSASLAGAEFQIKYYDTILNDNETSVPSTWKAKRSWVVATNENGFAQLDDKYLVSGDPFYKTSLGAITIPIGTITIQEIKAPKGYLLNDPTIYVRQVKPVGNSSLEAVENYDIPIIKEQVVRGGVKVAKWDKETDSDTPQGDSNFNKAVFDIYNRGANAVVVGGKPYVKDKVVGSIATDAKGIATTTKDFLPYGDFEIVERVPPQGHLNSGKIRQAFKIVENEKIVNLTRNEAIKNDVIRGGVQVEKWDIETDKKEPQGGTTLKDAVFDIYNRSIGSVVVGGVSYGKDEIVKTIITDKDGIAKTSNKALPFGTYEAVERLAPQGYLNTGKLKQIFRITEHEKMVILTGDTAIKNHPVRGDLEFVKVSDTDQKRLADVPFKITSKTTGESHVIVTDENGQAKTNADWVKHSQNTNQGNTADDGIWFGNIGALDDMKGALLYDTYIIEEMRCKTNEDYYLIPPFEVVIKRNNVAVELGTLTNDYVPVPEINTSAKFEKTDSKVAYADGKVTVVDTVAYKDLDTNQKYRLEGWQMLVDGTETGTELLVDGERVENEITFTPKKTHGTIDLTFTFDAYSLGGKDIVTFEELYADNLVFDKKVAEHKDIEDGGQTVTFNPLEISTSAQFEKTDSKTVYADGKVTVVDTVSYEGLTKDTEYLLKGWEMLKDDTEAGTELLIDGKKVENEITFTPKKSKGTIDLSFTFDAYSLGGKDIVTFEELYNNTDPTKPKLVAEHKDIEDRGQTVSFKPLEIGTSAKFEKTDSKTAYADGKVTVVDTVSYEGLTKGTEYLLKGWEMLVDGTEAGTELLVDGEKVENEIAFTPKQSKGTIELTFTFDSSKLGGKDIVTFEELYNNTDPTKPKLVAEHKDIEDNEQTVSFESLEIKTEAFFKLNKKKLAKAKDKITIVDTVSYKGLDVDTEYLLKGLEMLKDDSETGVELSINGELVKNEITFTPKDSTGKIELEITFDASSLSGRELVTFEELYNNSDPKDPKLVAVHKDIKSESQTVAFEGLPIKEVVKTGDTSGFMFFGALVAVSGLSLAFLVFVDARRRKLESDLKKNKKVDV